MTRRTIGLEGEERAREVLRDAAAELARLRRIRGAHRHTARRIRQARARLAVAAMLLGAPIGREALAGPPRFVNPLRAFGLQSVGFLATPALADLDGDGDLDVWVGESEGNTLLLENTGTANAPAFAAPVSNPSGLSDAGYYSSPAFADIDGDGDLDAFVGVSTGDVLFFANLGTSSSPTFALPLTNHFDLDASAGDYSSPAFADVDGDGDIDAFIGIGTGDTLFFENTGTASAPAFETPDTNPFGIVKASYVPAPVFADVDGDGDLDLFAGIGSGNTRFFENSGNSSAPAFSPPAENPFGLASVGGFASPDFGDIDGDGDLDAFVGDRFGHTLLFTNTGTEGAPAFSPPATQAFGLGEVENSVSPAFGDLDGDGDLDALVGDISGDTFFLENTGSASAPAFAPAAATNPFGLSNVTGDANPALADLDGDDDLDAILGTGDGNSVLFTNGGTPSAPAFAPPVTNPAGLSDVGDVAAPAFGDMDGDGDLDAFVGEEEGDTFFFSNSGTAGSPSFAAAEANAFGLENVGFGAWPAVADLDDDGDLDLLVGESEGSPLFFENTGTATAPAFAAPVTNAFGLGDVGADARPAFADIDGDRDLDVFVSRRGDGRVIFFENLAALCPGAPDAGCTEGFATGALSVNERKAGAEKLSLRLGKGPALTQADFRDPTASGGSAVALCIYDDAGARVAALEVERAGELCVGKACWKSLGNPPPDGKGFAYKDAAASADGVRSLALKGGAAGKSSLACVAANKQAKAQTALPTGIAAALQDTTSVTLQVRVSDGACFSRTLTQITKQESDRFKAK